MTSLITENPSDPPQLNRERVPFVLSKIDEILAWEQRKDTERDTKFVELGRYLCEVRERQYWRLEKLKSFDEFLTRRFPESRRKAYYLMSIHENLPSQARSQLKEIGWTKSLDLAKLAGWGDKNFNCATWLHKAKSMPKDQFRREVEKELTGEDSEPWELVYFKLYKSQIPVVHQTLEAAALMLGSGSITRLLFGDDLRRLSGRCKSRQRRSGNTVVLDDEILQILDRRSATGISRRFEREGVMSSNGPRLPHLRLDAATYERLRQHVLRRDGWRCQFCGTMTNLEVHHKQFRIHLGWDSEEDLVTLCSTCHARVHSPRS